jgi:hypothetical protein
VTAGLTIPAITADDGILDAALAYAKAGWYIGPLKAGTKHPGSILGKDWQRQTSGNPQAITAWFAGSNHGVFLHAGRSGAVIFDVDNPENVPAAIRQAVDQCSPPFQSTRPDKSRRGHYVFAMPAGRQLGNGLGKLAGGWGEIRGANGVIVVAPTVHPDGGEYRWLTTGAVPVLPGYLASRLPDAMDASEAATDADVAAFLAQHGSPSSPQPELLDVHVLAFQKAVSAGESRHGTMCGHLSGAMKEAAAGYLDAKAAADALESVFLEAVARPGSGKQGAARNGAVARDEWLGLLAWAVGQARAADAGDTRLRIGERFAKSSGSGQPPSGTHEQTELVAELFDARPELQRIRDFARARRVSPPALLGVALVRVVSKTPPNLVLPPLVGGPVSLNLFVGIVSPSGGGKDSAEEAATYAINTQQQVPTLGPGSGEGIAHLFVKRDKDGNVTPHTTSVILSASEVNTLAALKARQASTLLPELRKAWMGKELGFAYVDPAKKLPVRAHSYRLGLIVGIQPEQAAPILDDASAGTPQRFVWMPAIDPTPPAVKPAEPQQWRWHNPTGALTQSLRVLELCDTGVREIDDARVRTLRGDAAGSLDGHALLAQEKLAAALMLLSGRTGLITEEDWYLAGVVRRISNATRQDVINVQDQTKARQNRARAVAEADRAVVVESRRDQHAIQLAAQAIMRRLDSQQGQWVSHSELRRSLSSARRPYFEDAIAALIDAGQVKQRATRANHAGHQGVEYQSTR